MRSLRIFAAAICCIFTLCAAASPAAVSAASPAPDPVPYEPEPAPETDLEALSDSLARFAVGKDARIGVAVALSQAEIAGTDIRRPFPMMSVMKFPLALAVATHLQETGGSYADSIPLGAGDLRPDTYSPMRDRYAGCVPEKISIDELLDYSLRQSDNNAADILMRFVSGPEAVGNLMKELGYQDIHVIWNEDDMHRDTARCTANSSTPEDMAKLFLLFDSLLADEPEYAPLRAKLEQCETGRNRLAAPFAEQDIVIGHKTGTGDVMPNGRLQAVNDAGYVRLPDGRSYAIAVFIEDSGYSPAETERLIADISRLVYRFLTHPSDR